jgi:hypothetical protein
MKFNKLGEFTWLAKVGDDYIEIVLNYFGVSHKYYDLKINHVSKGHFEKLSDAKREAKLYFINKEA